MNQKNISIICIALCLILIGGYILRQNYLLEKAYKTAGIYDYIPAEESKIGTVVKFRHYESIGRLSR